MGSTVLWIREHDSVPHSPRRRLVALPFFESRIDKGCTSKAMFKVKGFKDKHLIQTLDTTHQLHIHVLESINPDRKKTMVYPAPRSGTQMLNPTTLSLSPSPALRPHSAPPIVRPISRVNTLMVLFRVLLNRLPCLLDTAHALPRLLSPL